MNKKKEVLKARMANIENAFVEHLSETCSFDRKGNMTSDFTNTLSKEECKLLDSIVELKEEVEDLPDEGRAKK